jgi:tRNA modification GTPase
MQAATIAAIATPHGTGGVAMIRLSGAGAIGIASRVFTARSGKGLGELGGYTGALGLVSDGGETLDEGICYVYRAPKSYTGEDVAELTLHGGVWLAGRVLRACLRHGAVLAAPGEFTKRAFLNGKLDLSQAEAVADLIAAGSELSLRAAVNAYGGKVSTAVGGLVEKLLAQAAHLAAWADYPEEEVEEVGAGQLAAALGEALAGLDTLLSTYDQGRILREGVRTAIVGKPNVGKSTLMNLLSGYERSIVTEIPGTTRDVVTESVRIGGIALQLFDTAGIRPTEDPVERAGVERSRQQIEQAELVLAVFDHGSELDRQDLELLSLLEGKRCIALLNKSDLPPRLDCAGLQRRVPTVVMISAKTGDGHGAFQQKLLEVLGMANLDSSAAIIASERQRGNLLAAKAALEQALEALSGGVTLDAVSVCIDEALGELLSLTGQRAGDRIIDEVFSRFCVGK